LLNIFDIIKHSEQLPSYQAKYDSSNSGPYSIKLTTFLKDFSACTGQAGKCY
jgi:hypothetical protein